MDYGTANNEAKSAIRDVGNLQRLRRQSKIFKAVELTTSPAAADAIYAITKHPLSEVQLSLSVLKTECVGEDASFSILHQDDPISFHAIPEFDPTFMLFTAGSPTPSLEHEHIGSSLHNVSPTKAFLDCAWTNMDAVRSSYNL